MSPLIPATVAALCGSFVLLWVYSRLYKKAGKRYLRFWMFAWGASLVRYTTLLVGLNFGASPYLDLVQYLATLVTGLLLLRGTYAYMERSLPVGWWLCYGAVAIWIFFALALQLSLVPLALPLFLALALTHLVTGAAILRSPEFVGDGKPIVGWTYILWGVHRANYPFMRLVDWFAPWGFIIAAILEIIVAAGTLLIYFDKTQAELQASQQRMAQDMLERRRAEAAEHEQRILAEALRDTAAALNSALNLPDVLTRILEHMARLVPHDAATVMLLDNGVARIVGNRGYKERGGTAVLPQIQFRMEESEKFTQMAETGQPLMIDDVQQDKAWIDIPETRWIRGYLGAPIRVEGEVIGFINLDNEKPNVFFPQHAETLKVFAEQAGVALRNARLYDKLRQQTVELELRVAERTAEMERERAQLRAILDGMGEGVIGMIFGSQPGEIIYRYTNSALQQLTGYAAEEWDPKTIFIGSLPPEKFTMAWKELLEGVMQNSVWRTETRVQRKDGTEFDASLTVTRLIGKEGQIEGVVSILRDISQEKALALQKANFVARASHELRTPLTNLKTWLYLLRRQPERLDSHLLVLEEVTERMKKLVEDLLDLTRFERGIIQINRQPVMLQELVARLVEIQQPEAANRQIELICELSDQPLTIEIDPDRIHQVVTNLVTNAIHHTPPGGRVTVTVFSKNGQDVFIQVMDSGDGIAPEHVPHIFEPFYRADSVSNGMGLGLSITREIVQLHGGDLTVTSEPGHGSCFTVYLPPPTTI